MPQLRQPIPQSDNQQSINTQSPVTEQEVPKMKKPGSSYKYFDNDLTPEQKERVLKLMTDITRKTLEQPKLSVNQVARLYSCEHLRVLQQQRVNTSLSAFVERQGKSEKIVRAVSALSKLTPEERLEIARQVSAGTLGGV